MSYFIKMLTDFFKSLNFTTPHVCGASKSVGI